jgi:2-C-methyl-D-erythritol 4-phosphate cytidylyltransferase
MCILEKWMIIVAGGKGKRMQAETPKQFLNIAGRPILMHTLKNISDYSADIKIIVALPDPFIDFWNSLCKRHNFSIPHQISPGGETRFQSVKNSLNWISSGSLAAVHDGVRPLVSHSTLNNVFKKAEESGNAIPVVKINESIRKFLGNGSIPVNRTEYRIIQTPQCFYSDLLMRAYQQEYHESFTDDATVVEALGEKINLVDGNFENIKITRPGDLKFAEALIKQ